MCLHTCNILIDFILEIFFQYMKRWKSFWIHDNIFLDINKMSWIHENMKIHLDTRGISNIYIYGNIKIRCDTWHYSNIFRYWILKLVCINGIVEIYLGNDDIKFFWIHGIIKIGTW